MKYARPLALIRAAIFPALAALIFANFAGYAVLGSNGLLAWGDYSRLHAHRSAEFAALDRERADLAHKVALLDQRRVDPDLADEMVRRELGLVRPDEIVIDQR